MVDETLNKDKITRICNVVKVLGITEIKIDYHGSGDSGAIQDINAYDKSNKNITLPDGEFQDIHGPITYTEHRWNADINKTITTEKIASIRYIIEEICYNYLEKKQPGWELNDGSYGTFIIDIEQRTLTLEHNHQFMETTESYYEEQF